MRRRGEKVSQGIMSQGEHELLVMREIFLDMFNNKRPFSLFFSFFLLVKNIDNTMASHARCNF